MPEEVRPDQSFVPPEPTFPSARELRAALREEGATWMVSQKLRGTRRVPRRGLGASTEGVPRAADVPPVDFGALLSELPGNPQLVRRAVELRLVAPEVARALVPEETWPALDAKEIEGTPKPTRRTRSQRKPKGSRGDG